MRNFKFWTILTLSLVLLAGSAFAGKPPSGLNHEIIVSQDGGGDFTNIPDALNAITDAGPENPYRITVKPGVYMVPEMSLPNYAYIDIVGSGPGNTILRSSPLNYVVEMNGNSTIRDLSIENLSLGAHNSCLTVNREHNVIDNVICSAQTGVWLFGTDNVVLNSTINSGSDGIKICANSSSLKNTVVKSDGGGIWFSNCNGTGSFIIEDSTVYAAATGITLREEGDLEIIIRDSVVGGTDAIYDDDQPPRWNYPTDLKLVVSQIIGNYVPVLGSHRIVNCYDGNFDVIPNQ